MRIVRLGSLLLLPLIACVADAGDDDAVSEADYTSSETQAILRLVNDTSLRAEDFKREARLTTPASNALVEHRDGPDATPGTDDDDPFDTLGELDAVPGIGPAAIRNLLEWAKRRGLLGGQEVVFSPQPAETSHLARIAKEIDAAQSSVDIAMYSYSDARIGAALANAVQRGVKVRFLWQDGGKEQRMSPADRARSKSGKLEADGIDVRYVNKTMHHKFAIIDGPRDDVAKARTARIVTGSANWSSSAATRYDENTLFLSNVEELALRFQQEFDLMWAHSRDVEVKTFPHELSTATIDEIPDDPDMGVFFTSANFEVNGTTFSSTARNTVADALVAAIQGATESIHVASGHLRSRPVAEALIAKKQAQPDLDIRVYLDGQEFIAKGTHQKQLEDLEECLVAAGASEAKQRACKDKGFLFGYQVGEAGIEVRYKYYAYRWDHSYAPQMHHKYMVVDHSTLFTGSYNLSDNAEHETFENMIEMRGAQHAALVRAFEENFESMWKTGRDENALAALLQKVETQDTFPIVFAPMALTWSEVSNLKQRIRTRCPAVDSTPFRTLPATHMTCTR